MADGSSDMKDRIAAFAGVEEVEGERDRSKPPVYVVPAQWTPEHVAHRLVDAFKVIGHVVRRPGPRSNANGWPEYVTEEGKNDDVERESKRPTAHAIDLADEAIQWVTDFLDDEPCLGDALQLWAWATAHGRNIAKVLRARCVAADRLRSQRCADLEAPRQARRKEIAAEALAWGNPRIDAAASRAEIDAIRGKMVHQVTLEIAREMLDLPLAPIRRSDVLPGKVYSRTRLDVWRKQAARKIAGGLRQSGKRVR